MQKITAAQTPPGLKTWATRRPVEETVSDGVAYG